MAQVYMAGRVNQNGTIVGGTETDLWEPDKKGTGVYEIDFNPNLPFTPVVVASTDGGDRGCNIRVKYVSGTKFRIEGRRYHDHGLADISFDFIVVGP